MAIVAVTLVLSVPLPAGGSADLLPLGGVTGPPDPGSTLLSCDRAGERIEISASTHLDPACVWSGGFDVVASDVVFDCQGAVVSAAPAFRGQRGIHIKTPTDRGLRRVTVRNCVVEQFMNSVHVERVGFRQLTPESGYHPAEVTEDIVIGNVLSRDSIGVGIFVNGFVTDVTIRDVEVTRAGSSGIYLDTDSRQNLITRAWVHHNGWRENGPGGQTRDIGGSEVWWWGTGREGISIDGSAGNHVVDNVIEHNTNGGILLYKNCGEFWQSRPDRWWGRFGGSHDNVIEHNTIRDEEHGVWVGSRMAENQVFMECSDPAYGEDGELVRRHEDQADDNIVRDNTFEQVRYGVRVEDDGTVVAGNRFRGDLAESLAVVVGTRYRAELLGRPVVGTTVADNTAELAGVRHPYRWIPSQVGTAFGANRSHGSLVGWCEGAQPQINPFLFVVAIEYPVPTEPIPPDPVPPVTQPPCPEGTDPTLPSTTVSTTASTAPGATASTSSAGLAHVPAAAAAPAVPSRGEPNFAG